MDEQEDVVRDKHYLDIKKQNQRDNFISYDPNEDLNLNNNEKLELYNIFIEIEKNLQKGGKRKKKRKTNRKRKINKRKKSKTKKRKLFSK